MAAAAAARRAAARAGRAGWPLPLLRPAGRGLATTGVDVFGLPLEALDTVPLALTAEGASSRPDATPLVILHGLFGSKQNWRTLQRSFAAQLGAGVTEAGAEPPSPATAAIVALDLRNHGMSPHTAQHTYELMAADVRRCIHEQLGGRRVHLMGHSMGGKVAMTLALREPELLASLIVVDVAPQAGHSDMSAFRGYIHDMRRVMRSNITSRKEADVILAQTVTDPMVRAFLLTNLVQEDGQWGFRINVDVLEASLDAVQNFDAGEAIVQAGVPSPAAHLPTLFVGGARGRYITEAHRPRISRLFPTAEVTMLPTGHWVHAEQPRQFMATVVEFLKRHAPSA